MSETGAKPRRRRIWRYLLLLAVSGILSVLGLLWYSTTDSFQAMVRHRLVAELERLTGGRVEVGSFHTIPLQFQIEVRDLTIHGREAPGEVPYAHVDSLVAQVKIISILSREYGFRSVVLDHPVIHLIVYPDGTTNQPGPTVEKTSSDVSVQQLFSLSVSHFQIRRGVLFWNDEQIPLDFTANTVLADLTYSLLHRQYVVNLLVGKGDTKFKNYRPIAWTGEAHFTLGHNQVEVHSLKATSGRSHFEMNGILRNFRQPKIEGTYDATVDLAEAGAVARQPGMRRGVLQVNGKGSWSGEDFSALGKLALKDFDWRNEAVSLHGVTAAGQFWVSPQRATLSQLEAKLLGGSVSGDAEITDWMGPAGIQKTKGGKKPAEEKGTIRLHIRDVSAADVLTALSSPSHPLNKMSLAGAASGTIEAHWKGSLSHADTEIALDVAAPGMASPSQIPLTAHARATYHAGASEWEVGEFSAATRSSQVRASGRLAEAGSLSLAVNTSDLGEWQRFLSAFGGPARIPATLHGQASFHGTVQGKLSDPTLSGKLVAEDFDATIPATQRTSEKEVHWDYLEADVQFSQRSLLIRNGTLQRGDAAIDFDANAGLLHGQFTEQSQFTAHLDMHHAQVEDMLALSGHNFPASGTVDLSLQVTGSWADLHGEGRLNITNAMVRGQPVQHFNANVSLNGDQIALSEIDLVHSDGHVRGDASYDLSARTFHCNLNGTNFDLTEIPQVQRSRVPIEGRMDFAVQSSGNLESPEINATVHLRNLTFGDELAGDFVLQGITQGSELHLTGVRSSRMAISRSTAGSSPAVIGRRRSTHTSIISTWTRC